VAQKVTLPPAVTVAVDLIEERIKHLQAPARNGNGEQTGPGEFDSGMVYGLREAEACLLQALVADGRGV
jgi:hypothetical protein